MAAHCLPRAVYSQAPTYAFHPASPVHRMSLSFMRKLVVRGSTLCTCTLSAVAAVQCYPHATDS